jgi:hypothetical protein
MFSQNGEILFLHGFVVGRVDFVDGVGTEEFPEVPAYNGDDGETTGHSDSKQLKQPAYGGKSKFEVRKRLHTIALKVATKKHFAEP